MRGILFRPEMLLAITGGRKTQTRRLMKPQPFMRDGVMRWTPRKGIDINLTDHSDLAIPFARYKVSEVVYIKEAWATENQYNHLKPREIPHTAMIFYPAGVAYAEGEMGVLGKKRSPLFMPEWAARILLEVTEIKIERLTEITEADCRREGSYMAINKDDEGGFVNLWDSLNAKRGYGWDINPFCWVISFKRLDYDTTKEAARK